MPKSGDSSTNSEAPLKEYSTNHTSTVGPSSDTKPSSNNTNNNTAASTSPQRFRLVKGEGRADSVAPIAKTKLSAESYLLKTNNPSHVDLELSETRRESVGLELENSRSQSLPLQSVDKSTENLNINISINVSRGELRRTSSSTSSKKKKKSRCRCRCKYCIIL